MKIRTDFVTNSSSSSYIICFARIENEKKAEAIMNKYEMDVLDKQGVRSRMYYGELGADWANAVIDGVDDILNLHPDSKYIIIQDSEEACYDEDSFEPIYNYDFDANEAIEKITEENGFADIHVAEGEGFNG